MLSQKQRIANTLRRAPDGVCARFMVYEMHPGIPRAAARISELRAEGMDIRTEPCDLHQGHDPQRAHIKYRFVNHYRYKSQPDSLVNPSIGRSDLATMTYENRTSRTFR